MAFDVKKEYKDLYQPAATPSIIEVPRMRFVAVEGSGDPNEEDGDYQTALQLLYGVSFTIKMSRKSKDPAEHIEGYYDYVVPPLEGLWHMDTNDNETGAIDYSRKTDFQWTSMIRLPEFVTDEAFDACVSRFAAKHPEMDVSRVFLLDWTEGLPDRSCTKAPTITSPRPSPHSTNTSPNQGTVSISIPRTGDSITRSIWVIRARASPRTFAPSSATPSCDETDIEPMTRSTIKAILQHNVQTVWSIVTNVDDYGWRSDLSKTEIVNDSRFVEYTNDGYATTFTVTCCEPCERWEFDMENGNMTGHWIGTFSPMGDATAVEFTEQVTAKKLVLRPFVKAYLKRQQTRYIKDLERALERR